MAISLALGPLYNRSTHASSTTTRVGGSRDGEVFVRAGAVCLCVKNVVEIGVCTQCSASCDGRSFSGNSHPTATRHHRLICT